MFPIQEQYFQRYQFNEFVQNELAVDGNDNDFNFYIRPYIPFWSAESLMFEEIASFGKIPTQRTGPYSRYVLEKLCRTWLSNDPHDKQWFDQEAIFKELKEDVVLKLQSKYQFSHNGKIKYFAL